MEVNSDFVQVFNTELNFYLTKLKQVCPLIRINRGHLSSCGDFSFPLNFKYWVKYLKKQTTCDKFTGTQKDINPETIVQYCYLIKIEVNLEEIVVADFVQLVLQKIIDHSKSWTFVISSCKVEYEKVQIFLDRKLTFEKILQIILFKKSSYGHSSSKQKSVSVISNVIEKDTNEMDLSEMRVELLRNTIVNLATATGYQVSDKCDRTSLCLHLTTKSTTADQDSCQKLLCGVVINSKHHSKESNANAQHYLRQRCADIKIMAEYKYGSMGETQPSMQSFLCQLGDAAMKMDLLGVKPSHTVTLNFDDTGNHETSNKGAVFALYNCARLSAILCQFEEKVKLGYYPPLIPFDDVDFSLLVKEEEWELLFLYLLSYPSLLKNSLQNIEEGKVSPNLLCKFIMDMCSCFSVYYRRVRILTEPRSQLLPVMFARLYLLQGVQQVLHNALDILGISPVLHM